MTWRTASPCTSRGAQPACGTPLISTRRPPRTETLTSWRLAPDAHPHVAGRAADAADEQDRLLDLVGRAQVRAGHGLDQRHAQPVGAPDDQVARSRDLAAGVLLDADLGDRELAAAERQPAVDADDGGALEAGGDGAVQVLLAGDVHLVDDVAAQHQALLDGHVERLPG